MTDDTQVASDGILYAGTLWYPRRDTRAREHAEANTVHWFYGPRLRPGVDNGLIWCRQRIENHSYGFVSNSDLSEDLTQGTPCADCEELHPLPTGVPQ